MAVSSGEWLNSALRWVWMCPESARSPRGRCCIVCVVPGAVLRPWPSGMLCIAGSCWWVPRTPQHCRAGGTMSPPEHQQRLQGKRFPSYGHSASPLIPGAVGIKKEVSFCRDGSPWLRTDLMFTMNHWRCCSGGCRGAHRGVQPPHGAVCGEGTGRRAGLPLAAVGPDGAGGGEAELRTRGENQCSL